MLGQDTSPLNVEQQERPDVPGGHPEGKSSVYVDLATVQQAIKAAVANCDFCVTVANPQDEGVPLIAVSEAFSEMTGYRQREILGLNCRFLNTGCDVSCLDIIGLRTSSMDGRPVVALLPNRKKSGDLFVNMLDLQGLAVARNASTGELLWYCIGIQEDVTEEEDYRALSRHSKEREEIVQEMQRQLRNEAVDASASGERHDLKTGGSPELGESAKEQYELLAEPYWISGLERGADSSAGSLAGEASAVPLAVTAPPGTAGMRPSPLGWWRSLWRLRPWADGSQELRTASFQAFAQAYATRAVNQDAQPGQQLAGALTSTWLPLEACEAAPWKQFVVSLPSMGILLFLVGTFLCRVKQQPAICGSAVPRPT